MLTLLLGFRTHTYFSFTGFKTHNADSHLSFRTYNELPGLILSLLPCGRTHDANSLGLRISNSIKVLMLTLLLFFKTNDNDTFLGFRSCNADLCLGLLLTL